MRVESDLFHEYRDDEIQYDPMEVGRQLRCHGASAGRNILKRRPTKICLKFTQKMHSGRKKKREEMLE